MHMLHGPLGQVLPFGDGLRLLVPLNNDDRNTALSQFDSQPHADRSATHNEDLCIQIVRNHPALPVIYARIFCPVGAILGPSLG